MANSKSEVLPLPVGLPDGEEGLSILSDDLGSLFHSRPSRPCQDNRWCDEDHYFQHDAPVDVFDKKEWKETYKDLDKIQVNGAIQRQWKRGRIEFEQILAQCKDVIGKESLSQGDFVEYFHGANSPLFHLFQKRLDWNHCHYCKFMITNERLSANQWTTAKLYNKEHPQMDIDQCMDEDEFIRSWKQIKSCGISATREEAANGEISLWEECQIIVSQMCCTFTIKR